ncbi:ABC transporter permease subunit [Aestuariirhabdus litorea]|uniref:ABC transporter permease subunit n=1 Tax=Aestuariirhabdus litorea TaxID=2528527 RepID=A0A3P3VS97_9GAMM|nr:ABC transporter permease subunit [Aestuariirhabdus litorea]RRJ85187.1 ABC transporter permease subunit [Aestuariirhabdus litorea]RWW98408.1 ABC transporter permease subunit [Endozoicomonadaceae bacterium GTF-13]
MAPRRLPLASPLRPGLLLAGGLALAGSLGVTLLAFAGLIGFSASGPDWRLLQDPYFYQVLRFSLWQALLSSLLAVLPAWPIARALYYLPRLPARRAFLGLCLLYFVMPTLILITGLVALLGHAGLLSPLISHFTGSAWNLYGLGGIVLAHLLLNLPLAVRLLYLQLQAIPASSWQLARQLKLGPRQRLRLIEWPALKGRLWMLLGLVFILCFNSFAIVLALGGGPQSTTLEVAIYQALKYDFNPAEALTLAWAQLLIAGGLFLLVMRRGGSHWLSPDTDTRPPLPRPAPAARLGFQLLYYGSWLLLLLPLGALLPALVRRGLPRVGASELLLPTLLSLALALAAALAATALAYLVLQPLRAARRRGQSGRALLLEWLATHQLVTPAMVLSVGLFILLLPHPGLLRWGLLWVALLNALLVLPFAVQQLKPRLLQFDQQYAPLVTQLKLGGLARWRVEWPFMRPVLAASFALALVLALGDVAIFAIFGDPARPTLPWLIYGYASSYRIAEASLASLLLLLLCALGLWGIGRLQRPAPLAPPAASAHPPPTSGDAPHA